MKEKLDIDPYEKQLLNQRNIIETVIEHLKYHYHTWHIRHRSILNAMIHLLAAFAAYAIARLRLLPLNCSPKLRTDVALPYKGSMPACKRSHVNKTPERKFRWMAW